MSEVLAEEVLLSWLSGWTLSGRRGVLVSYEAFAPLLIAGLVSHLKHRRLATEQEMPSLNLLLTSYGWHNVYTHGDPSMTTALLATGDPAVRVMTPADHRRTALTLGRGTELGRACQRAGRGQTHDGRSPARRRSRRSWTAGSRSGLISATAVSPTSRSSSPVISRPRSPRRRSRPCAEALDGASAS